jgi:hypothetical protein
MKYEEIQEMLDRYWEGETTLEEERRIKTYFNSGKVDRRLQTFAPMFQAFREEQAVQLTTKAKTAAIRPQMYQWAVAASGALLLAVGWWMLQDAKTAAPMAEKAPIETPKNIETPTVESPRESVVLRDKLPSKSIEPKRKKRAKPSPSIDAETAQAMAEIKAALALVSSKLDKGRSEAVKGASFLEAMDKVPKRKAG